MVLEIDNIAVSFAGKPILTAGYLQMKTGCVTGLFGRNGTGKSCLMQLIFGSLHGQHKLIRIDEHPIQHELFATQQAAYLPQQSFLPKNLSLRLAFKLYKASWDDFLRFFPDFSIYENAQKKGLSSGEIRIIELFLILSSQASILLLDEPFAQIAPVHVEKMLTMIDYIKAKKAILVADHNYETSLAISDALAMIHRQQLKPIANREELVNMGYLRA